MASSSKIGEYEETNVSTELSLWSGLTFDKSEKTTKSSSAHEETTQEAHNLGTLLELKSYEDLWKIKKVLKKSDVDSSCRLLLAKRLVEDNILALMDENWANDCRTKEGRRFDVVDCDTNSTHQLELKKWKTNSFVMTSNWKKEFVSRRGLEEGDEIGVRSDGTRFYFSLLRKRVLELLK